MSTKVVVVGAGVSGLTCAIRLAEDPGQRFDVRIIAEDVAGASMSSVAAASFYPYAVAHPNVAGWMQRSLRTFCDLAADPATGVALVDARQVFTHTTDDPSWRHHVLDYQKGVGDAAGLAPRFVDGYRFRTAIIEMPLYLDYLARRFDGAGDRIEHAAVTTLDEVAEPDTIVVNCAGALAGRLVDDRLLQPTLGQVVRVAPGGFQEFRIHKGDETRPTYVVPRATDRILGSIDEPWSLDRGYTPPPADLRVARDIIERCAELDPSVRDAEILDSYCGLRPRRPSVRLGVDEEFLRQGRRVVHDYGHGGAGVTLSWGCAADVVDAVASLIEVNSSP